MKVKSDDNFSRHLRRIVESYTEFVRKELQDAAFLKELERFFHLIGWCRPQGKWKRIE